MGSKMYQFTGSALKDKVYNFNELKFDTEQPSRAFSDIENNNYLNRSTCDQHAGGEDFNDCFSREFGEFCDGFLGCLSLATNPAIISGVIAVHCLVCDEDEEDDENDD